MAPPEVQEQNSPATVTFMTTEHFVLQTARSAGIAELNGRAGFYLAAVSSGLIALAFIGQLSRLGTGFYVFGLVLLPGCRLWAVNLTRFIAWRRRSCDGCRVRPSRERRPAHLGKGMVMAVYAALPYMPEGGVPAQPHQRLPRRRPGHSCRRPHHG